MIELRSDTFTKPSEAMLKAMMAAQVGDDVFGEDPSVNELETYTADLFGMEAALFCPSGTMTNQIAINVHTRPGDEVICEETAHVYYYEGGGIAKNSGCQTRLIKGDWGRITAAQVAQCINPDDVHRPKTRLVCLENTSNRGGGSCYEQAEMTSIRELCHQHALSLHLDGARLMNAIVAGNEDPKFYGKTFHSLSLCLSKGLGAPVGSVLIADKAFIKEARRVRKVMGGGMRQAGYLAKAGLFALKNNVERLQLDHLHAQMLSDALEQASFVQDILPVETNIVIFRVNDNLNISSLVAEFGKNGIRCVAISANQIRMVTHLDVSEDDIKQVVRLIQTMN